MSFIVTERWDRLKLRIRPGTWQQIKDKAQWEHISLSAVVKDYGQAILPVRLHKLAEACFVDTRHEYLLARQKELKRMLRIIERELEVEGQISQETLERCSARSPGGVTEDGRLPRKGTQCGLEKGHDGEHTILISTGSPWCKFCNDTGKRRDYDELVDCECKETPIRVELPKPQVSGFKRLFQRLEHVLGDEQRFAQFEEDHLGVVPDTKAHETLAREIADRLWEFAEGGNVAGPRDFDAVIMSALGATPVEATSPQQDYKALYYELIYEVAQKYPGESRHDTARRYIRERETPSGDAASGKSASPQQEQK